MAGLHARKYQSLTLRVLRERLDYDPDTGVFVWKARAGETKTERSFNSTFAGRRAGTLSPEGYRQIKVEGHIYREHILAWFYVTGEWPAEHIDHIDADKGNSRFANLRLATVSQNGANMVRNGRNTSGLKGVSFDRATGRWRAALNVRGRYFFLGRFRSPAHAHQAYLETAQRLQGAFARG